MEFNEVLFSLFDLLRIVAYTPVYLIYFLDFLYLRKITEPRIYLEPFLLGLFFFMASNIIILDNTVYTLIDSGIMRHFITIPSVALFIYTLFFKNQSISKVYFKENKMFVVIKK